MPPSAQIEAAPSVAVAPPSPVAEARPPEAARAHASTPAPSAELDGQTYVREAQPAGGQPVKVGFIVWSEAPFAQVNGQLLSPGQSIDGYTLLTVERDRVELEGAGSRFWLRVK